MLGLLLVGAAIRFIGIGKQELWLDECLSVIDAKRPDSFGALLRHVANAPLYFVLLRGWMEAFGLTPAAVRALSLTACIVQLAVVAVWLRELGLSRRVAVWAVVIGVCTPLQIHFSQITRTYTLAWLVVACLLWTFTRAIRRRSRGAMALHGVCLALAICTHDLTLGFVPAIWAAAWVLRPRRREWIALLVTHATVGLVMLPWMLHVAGTANMTGADWIAPLWNRTAAWRIIPSTLLTLSGGGYIPTRLWQPRLPNLPQHLIHYWIVPVVLFAFWEALRRLRQPGNDAVRDPAKGDAPAPWRILTVLMIFTIVPLLLPLFFSILVKPIYAIGRYDTLVYPALLGWMAFGTAAIERELRRFGRPLAVGLPLAIWVMPAWFMIQPRLPGGRAVDRVQAAQGALLARYARPDDLIVCLGYEGAFLSYEMLRHPIRTPWTTFPPSTRKHLGVIDGHLIEKLGAARLREEAATIVRSPEARANAGNGATRPRLWVLPDPDAKPPGPGTTFVGEYHWNYDRIFREALKAGGWVADEAAGIDPQSLADAHLEVYDRPSTSTTTTRPANPASPAR